MQSPPYSSHTYLSFYCFSMFTNGIFVSSIGVLIPFLSLSHNTSPTYYSFLFISRTIGTILGFLLYRYLHSIFMLQHTIIKISGAVIFVFMWMFMQGDGWVWQGMCMVVMGCVYYCGFAAVNVGIIEVSKDKASQWVPLTYAFVGVGALICPLLFRYLQLNTYYYTAWLYLITAIITVYLPSPQHRTITKNPQQQTFQMSTIDANSTLSKVQLWLCATIFINMGLMMTVPGWLPSYGIMLNAVNKQQSTICVSLFWLLNCSVKFAVSAWQQKASQKIRICLIAGVISGLLYIPLRIAGMVYTLLIVTGISYGASFSCNFALLMSLGAQFNIKLNAKQMSNMVLSNQLAGGILTAITGYFMNFSPELLFGCLFGMTALLIFGFRMLMGYMEQEGERRKEGVQMKEKLIESA